MVRVNRRHRSGIGRSVDIGSGRRMYLECAGTGSPTVVLVSGLRGSAQEWNTTESTATPPAPPAFGEVAKTNRVCAYDRPGTVVADTISRSDPVPQPTTAEAAATDLHLLCGPRARPAPLSWSDTHSAERSPGCSRPPTRRRGGHGAHRPALGVPAGQRNSRPVGNPTDSWLQPRWPGRMCPARHRPLALPEVLVGPEAPGWRRAGRRHRC